MAPVVFDSVSIHYPGAARPTLTNLNLHIDDGEFLVLVGPSGSGKSTILRALAGLEPTSSGSILIGDKDVTDSEPRERDIAMVFQDYALYPHLTVEENMGFALSLAKTPKAEIRRRVEEVADMLNLQPLLKRKPKELSGGQRQRVAMGRAIVRQPQVFLMDEPLSNLDAQLRVQTRAQIVKLQSDLNVTTVYVTHDQVEAMTMGDRVAVLKDGVLQQVAAPQTLYHEPVNIFVAEFIGSPSMNILPTADLPMLPLPPLPADCGQKIDQEHLDRTEFSLGIRPEHCELSPADRGIPAVVTMVEELGSDAYVYAQSEYGQLIARLHSYELSTPPARNSQIHIGLRPEAKIHYFHSETGLRIHTASFLPHSDETYSHTSFENHEHEDLS